MTTNKITSAAAGEPFNDGPVLASCGDNNGHWCCTTHATAALANNLQKDIHIRHGNHHLVWICHTHGPEQP